MFALTSTNRVLRINTATAQATLAGSTVDGGSGSFLAGLQAGFEFNPVVDRLRIVNGANDNIRYNPVTSALVAADTDLAFISTDANVGVDPNIVGLAYDRNDNDPATPTTPFLIDSNLNILVRLGAVDGVAADTNGGGSPNGGLLTTLGSLGVNQTDVVGFDISGTGRGGNGAALAVMQLQGETVSKLFQINIQSGLSLQALGTASLVGTVGGGELIVAMAIAPPSIQFSRATFAATERGGTASIVITRTGGSATVNTVVFSALAGTAQVGDFTSPNQTVTFGVGETSKTITFAITRDNVAESAVDVLLTLSGITGGNTQLGLLSSALLVITDR